MLYIRSLQFFPEKHVLFKKKKKNSNMYRLAPALVNRSTIEFIKNRIEFKTVLTS